MASLRLLSHAVENWNNRPYLFNLTLLGRPTYFCRLQIKMIIMSCNSEDEVTCITEGSVNAKRPNSQSNFLKSLSTFLHIVFIVCHVR